MQQARDILQAALAEAGDDLTRKRIEFLAAGLDHVELCGKLVDAPKKDKPGFARQILKFNERMTSKFGYWGSRELFVLNHWGLLDVEIDVEGM